MDNRHLLCTFSDLSSLHKTLEQIRQFYSVNKKLIFVFSNAKNEKELYLTYNIVNDLNSEFPKFKNTISIHRKKQTNTLYTLNAMNQIIRDENGGVLDTKFSIPWESYKDSLIITTDSMIKIIPIKFYTLYR